MRLIKTILENIILKTGRDDFGKGSDHSKTHRNPRKKMGKAFEKMHKNNDDRLLFHDVFEDENFEEWN